MNKSLAPFASKLKWQLAEVRQCLQASNEKKAFLQDKLETLAKEIQQACITPAFINPEQEIGRLNFISQQQQFYENDVLEKKAIEEQEYQLAKRAIDLKKALKMLTIYQEKQKEICKKKELALQQKENDEWFVHRSFTRLKMLWCE